MKRFQEFYKDNKDRFFGYLLRRTGDYQLSVDTLQESFTKYLEQYGKGVLNVSLLFTIGRNLLNDDARKKQKRNNIPYDEERHLGTFNLESTCMLHEESRRVLKALQQLPSADVDILSLVVSKGLSYREIAELTGTSESNIKVKIHRTRLKLRQILQTGEL